MLCDCKQHLANRSGIALAMEEGTRASHKSDVVGIANVQVAAMCGTWGVVSVLALSFTPTGKLYVLHTRIA